MQITLRELPVRFVVIIIMRGECVRVGFGGGGRGDSEDFD